MCRLRNIALHNYQENMTTGQTDKQKDKQMDGQMPDRNRLASKLSLYEVHFNIPFLLYIYIIM